MRVSAASEPTVTDGLDVDLYTAGPPCVTFSPVGLREGFDDAHGTGLLFLVSARRIMTIRPKLFVMENVLAFAQADKGRHFHRLLRILKGNGEHLVEHRAPSSIHR